jgi:hypothetical protein
MAQKSQQSYLSVATAQGSTDTITGITNADPGVVSSTSHGNANGTVGIITGVLGMTQVNNRAFVVSNTATNAFDLKGLSTATTLGYGVYASGGIWTPQTMTEVGEVRDIQMFDGQDQEIDVTHLRSTGKEYLTGLPEFGSVQLVLWLPASVDTGQRKIQHLREQQASAAFSVTLPSGLISAFVGIPKSWQITGISPEGAPQVSCTIKVSNQPAAFA